MILWSGDIVPHLNFVERGTCYNWIAVPSSLKKTQWTTTTEIKGGNDENSNAKGNFCRNFESLSSDDILLSLLLIKLSCFMFKRKQVLVITKIKVRVKIPHTGTCRNRNMLIHFVKLFLSVSRNLWKRRESFVWTRRLSLVQSHVLISRVVSPGPQAVEKHKHKFFWKIISRMNFFVLTV